MALMLQHMSPSLELLDTNLVNWFNLGSTQLKELEEL
jgi:hypothetical protein